MFCFNIQVIPFIACEELDGMMKTLHLDETSNSTKKIIPIEESIITLLVKIMHKYQCNSKTAETTKIPLFELKTDAISDSRIGGEYYFISNLLNKAASLSLKCKNAIETVLNEIKAKKGFTNDDNERELYDDRQFFKIYFNLF